MIKDDIAAAVGEARTLLEEEIYADAYTIERAIYTADDSGGYTETWSTSGSGLCRLRSVGGGSEQVIADRLGWSSGYAIDLALAVDVTPADRLVVNGRTMEIGGVTMGGNFAVQKTIVCKEQG